MSWMANCQALSCRSFRGTKLSALWRRRAGGPIDFKRATGLGYRGWAGPAAPASTAQRSARTSATRPASPATRSTGAMPNTRLPTSGSVFRSPTATRMRKRLRCSARDSSGIARWPRPARGAALESTGSAPRRTSSFRWLASKGGRFTPSHAGAIGRANSSQGRSGRSGREIRPCCRPPGSMRPSFLLPRAN